MGRRVERSTRRELCAQLWVGRTAGTETRPKLPRRKTERVQPQRQIAGEPRAHSGVSICVINWAIEDQLMRNRPHGVLEQSPIGPNRQLNVLGMNGSRLDSDSQSN
jgi:hypothetical protein